MIITMDWRITLVCLAAFVISVAATRIVSVGSLLVVSLFLIMWLILGQMGLLPLAGEYLLESYVIVLLFAALAYWRHRANIKRLFKRDRKQIRFQKINGVDEKEKNYGECQYYRFRHMGDGAFPSAV